MRDTFEMESKMTEVIDRCRRMETRLTKYLEAQGFDTGTKRPIWRDGTIVAPSIDCSMRQLLGVVPPNWPTEEEIYVSVKGDLALSIYLPSTMPEK